jgi:hypothetical protein
MGKYALTYVVFNNVACPGTAYDSEMSLGLEYYKPNDVSRKVEIFP